MPTIMEALDDAIVWARMGETLSLPYKTWLDNPKTAVQRALQHLSSESDLPLVILFDEADGLTGKTMVTFLTQLRKGYLSRDRIPFPHTVALIGQR